MPLDAVNSALESGGIPTWSWSVTHPDGSRTGKPIGTWIAGFILDGDTVPDTDPATKKVKTWDDGRPKSVTYLTLQTELRDLGPDDDGKRNLYLSGNAFTASREALKAAAPGQGFRPGGWFMLQLTGRGTPQPGMSPPNLFTAQYQPPAIMAPEPAPAPPVNPGPVQQYAQYAAQAPAAPPQAPAVAAVAPTPPPVAPAPVAPPAAPTAPPAPPAPPAGPTGPPPAPPVAPWPTPAA